MDINITLQSFSFHATWNLKEKLGKSFNALMTHVDQHIKNETHKTFQEEGLLFKSYLHYSGIEKNKNEEVALDNLNEAIYLIKKWEESSKKNGFLAVAYALEAWIDDTKTETRLEKLQQIYPKKQKEQQAFKAAIRYIKGWSLSRLGSNRYCDSIQEFQQAAKKCPDDPEYLFSLALMMRKFYGSSNEVKNKLKEVLEMQPGYLYAKVELADIIHALDGDTDGANKLLEEVTKAIIPKEPITPENKKILGLVMKAHLQLDPKDADQKVKNIYETVEKSVGSVNSIIAHQRALLAKNSKDWISYKKFLKEANKLDPSNINVELELAKQEINDKYVDDVNKKYKSMYCSKNHQDNKLSEVKILVDQAFMLRNKDEKMSKYKKAMAIAIQYCQLNSQDTSNRIQFMPTVGKPVMFAVLKITELYKENPFELMNFQYEMRNFYLAHKYCEKALKQKLSTDKKYKASCISAEIGINLSSSLPSLEKVEQHLKNMEELATDDEEKKKVKELQTALNFKTTTLQERMQLCKSTVDIDESSILWKYCNLAKEGLEGAIKRLLSNLEIMDERNSVFYETCAYLEIGINALGSKGTKMKEKFLTNLNAAKSGDLYNLRNLQLEMEKAVIQDTENNTKVIIVIHTSRSLLNHAMNRLDKRYRKKEKTTETKKKSKRKTDTPDFFWISKNFGKKNTKSQILKKLRQHDWDDGNVDNELVEFLEEIQPCYNPKENNWIIALAKFDNTDKHNKTIKRYEKVEVYNDKGTEYQEEQYDSLKIARKVCNDITYILDNLNGFSPIFDKKEIQCIKCLQNRCSSISSFTDTDEFND